MGDPKKHGPSKEKAAKILKDGTVHGKALTEKQKAFMGVRAGGVPVKGKKKK